MKPIRIEFIEDTRWRAVWTMTVLACTIIVGYTVWQWRVDAAAIKAIEEQIADVKRKAAEVQAAQNRVDPRGASVKAMTKLLQRDLNKVFAVVENVQEPGVRLRSLSLDESSGSLRLEYELESMAHASTVTTALNAGYERGPWQLENVSGALAQRTGGGQQAFRGSWSAQLDKL